MVDKTDKFPSLLNFLLSQKRAIEYDTTELRLTTASTIKGWAYYAKANKDSTERREDSTRPKIANVCSTWNQIIGRVTVNSTYQNQMKIKWKYWRKRGPACRVYEKDTDCLNVGRGDLAAWTDAPNGITRHFTKMKKLKPLHKESPDPQVYVTTTSQTLVYCRYSECPRSAVESMSYGIVELHSVSLQMTKQKPSD